MIELNNCTTCGRKPSILRCLPVMSKNYHAYCKCGKAVEPILGNIWTPEVAADMWNLANPKEEEVKSDIVNRIAHDLAVCAIKVDISTGKIKFKQSDNCGFSELLVLSRIVNAQRYEDELTEFYKKRLEPGVKV